jgi:hypothetical protein
MKFVEPSAFADPDVAARKLVEIANVVEAVQDGRLFIELTKRNAYWRNTSNHDPRTTSAFSPNWWKFSNGPIWLSP